MERKHFLILLALLLMFTTSAIAESSGRNSDKRYMGFAPAFATYGSILDTSSELGYGAGGKIEMPLADILKLEVRGGWLTDVKIGKSDVDTDVVPVDVGLALHVPGRLFDRVRENNIRPIFLGGATWAYMDLENGYGSADDWGWYAGGGVEIGKERGVGLLVEALYRDLDVNNNGVSGDIGGAMGNVGLYYRW